MMKKHDESPSLANAERDSKHPIDDYVKSLKGKRSIRKILIANNGIAAVKAIRSIRRWSYETFGNERAVEFVSMATPEDVSANAEYVRMADMWTSVPGGSNNHNFANVDLITDIADRFSCDAVWAGWGHASENPDLPAKLSSMGITFLGPNPKSMYALGDKIASTIIAQSANVPTVAWSGSQLTVDYKDLGSVPDDVYQEACILSADHARRVAEKVGYPLVVKASEGGGGKGIRVVFEENAICAAYRQVASEVPGSPVFLMRLVQDARHLEVQIVADETGDAIALYGRDCSVQRRHQKIIEEGPVVAAPPAVWKALERAAIALAKEVGYVGAGTVEYLYKGDKENGEFYFLELNPRLQVEHPVTEWITGVNLPALQLHIGMGIPLKNVATIRKFLGLPELMLPMSEPQVHPTTTSPLKLTTTPFHGGDKDGLEELNINSPVPPHGHVIACRVTAENPDEGFQPTSGAIQELTFRNTPNVWGYFSVGASGGVHEFADSQFGHLFAWGDTRESSRRSLVLALKELSIRGDIRTTVEYLIKLLEMEAFKENRITTAWLDSLIADKVAAEKPPTDLAVVIGAVCRAHMDFSARAESFTKCLERGQLPPLDKTLVEFPVELIYEDVKYSFTVTRSDVSAFKVRLAESSDADADGSQSVHAELRTLADGAKLVLANGRSHVCYAREEPAGLRLSIDGKTCLFPKDYDPTTLSSSVSGKLVRYLVESDEHVAVGQPYVELEVMKMYLTLSTPESGRIRLLAPEASSIEIGDVIARLELDDPSKVRRAELFHGHLPNFAPPQALGSKPHQQFVSAKRDVTLLLRGFDARPSALEDFMDAIDDVRVCAGEIREVLSSLSGRIPTRVSQSIEAELRSMLAKAGVPETKDLGGHVKLHGRFAVSDDGVHLGSEEWLARAQLVSLAVSRILLSCQGIPEAEELANVARQYTNGTVLATTLAHMLDEYLDIEKLFARRTGGAVDALFELRDAKKGDLASVVEVAASHVRLKDKNSALVRFLKTLTAPSAAAVLAEENAQTAEFKARLHQLSQLYAPEYSDIALRARLMLADLRKPHFHQRRSSVLKLLQQVVNCDPEQQGAALQNMVSMSESILDVLVSFVLPSNNDDVSPAVRKIAAKIQLLRSYRAYEVTNLEVVTGAQSNSSLTAEWRFRFLKRDDSNTLANGISNTVKNPVQMPRGITSFDSADNLSNAIGGACDPLNDDSLRVGLLTAFNRWETMEEEFDSILESHANKAEVSSERDVNVMTILLRWDSNAFSNSMSASGKSSSRNTKSGVEHGDDLRDPFASESVVSQALSQFCKAKGSRRDLAAKAGLKSITFIVAPAPSNESVTYPGFYTFRVKGGFEEDPIYRHIDPPMAFQLELSRLSNFSINRFGYPTRSVHVFFAQDKTNPRRMHGGGPATRERPPLRNGSVEEKAPAANRVRSSSTSDAIETKTTMGKNNSTKTDCPQEDPKPITGRVDRDVDARFFVRAVIRQADVFANSKDGAVVSMPEAERTFVEALDAIEMASCDRRFRRTDFNHIFLNVVPPVQIDIDDVETICRRMFQRYAIRCWSLRVFAVEIKVAALVVENDTPSTTIPLRFLLFNPTGHMLRVESYVESTDRNSGVEKIISVSQENPGSLHGSLVSDPYPVMDRIQRRRVVAQAMETTYVYDFLQIFTKQLQQLWRRYSEERLLGGFRRHKIPVSLIDSTELVLCHAGNEGDEPQLVEAKRQPGLNDIGMVSWLCTLRTPEYPQGREVIIIANDITFRSGSFGPDEDALFYAASKKSREEGIPRIYLAANSGARIGVADEIRECLQVDWIDPSMPSKGFKRLAVKECDLPNIASFIKTGKKVGEDMVEVVDIIGEEHGLGVENLMGSGLIAGETSKAYDETFTITYVTARSVGIGAYLVRLGQRVIQKESAAPIILTGFSALNKVLGHEVYLSNEQLGGAKVMFPNGISHAVVRDDVQGVGAVLNWLSYVPRVRGDRLPIIESRDPVSRPVFSKPPSTGQAYDPRVKLIAGESDSSTEEHRFLGGLFDKDSFREYLDGWAKTVVVGRGRLGGVPTGIVAVETRSVERVTPADPASPETRESVVTQAGQVWYPDSAAKTARAIRDFDREGLPLFILANWRGFSGGMRDMYDEILKSGSEIVDALRSYKQPVFVYIPPGGELRGGAWVVLDTLINPTKIEMYADTNSRGGVLEPEGTVDVKYRRRNIIKTMHRLDPKLRRFDQELSEGKRSGGFLSDERKRAIYEAVYAREVEILPMYRNVATAFCDLHDTPGRLLAKKAIRDVIEWHNARSFFYWRMQRRLAEERMREKLSIADQSLSHEKITGLLKKWAADYKMESGMSGHTTGDDDMNTEAFPNDSGTSSFERDDKWVFHWLEVEEDAIEKRIEKVRTASIASSVSCSYKQSREGFLDGMESAMRNCSSSGERSELISAIQSKIGLVTSSGSTSSSSLGILSRLGKLGWDRDTRLGLR